jgi:Spermidine/putrescine-binding periplasmic protein
MTSTICSLNRFEDPVVIKKPMLRPLAAVLILGVANLAPACLTPAFAAAGKITFVSQGGTIRKRRPRRFSTRLRKLLNITVNQDSIPDAWPQIKAPGRDRQADLGRGRHTDSNCLRGGKEGLLEKLDFSKIPNAAAMPEKYRTPYSSRTSSIRR